MATKIYEDLDLQGNELQNTALARLASAPTGPAVGQIYFDTVLGYERVWNGTAWHRASFATDPFARANHTGTQLASSISDLLTAILVARIDQFAAPTAPLAVGSQRITNVADPTSASDVATRQWVEAQITGLSWKQAVRLATNAALPSNTRSGNVLTAATNGALVVDNVSAANGNRILVKNEVTGANNGFFDVTAAGSGGTPWILTRSADADTSGEMGAGVAAWVNEGDINQDKAFGLATNNPITLNTTALTFTQVGGGGGGSYAAGNGLALTGTTFRVNPGTGLVADGTSARIDTAVVPRMYSTTIGNGSLTSIPVDHNLNTKKVGVHIYEVSTDAKVDCDIVRTSVNRVTLGFAVAPGNAALEVVVFGAG